MTSKDLVTIDMYIEDIVKWFMLHLKKTLKFLKTENVVMYLYLKQTPADIELTVEIYLSIGS